MRTLILPLALALAAPLLHGTAHAAPKKEKVKPGEGIITWRVSPPDAVIFVDGAKIGTAATAKPFKTKAGMHVVKVQVGKDEAEEPVEVRAGESIEFQYQADEGG